MVPRPGAARSLLIEVLATLIERYESREYPIPEVAPAEMLAKLLATKEVKPSEVAKATGIPTATLSNVLAGRRGISKQNAFRLGEYFGVSPMAFLGGQSRKRVVTR
jgi:HTH-type transcriptional regulator/antitoxin HigA